MANALKTLEQTNKIGRNIKRIRCTVVWRANSLPDIFQCALWQQLSHPPLSQVLRHNLVRTLCACWRCCIKQDTVSRAIRTFTPLSMHHPVARQFFILLLQLFTCNESTVANIYSGTLTKTSAKLSGFLQRYAARLNYACINLASDFRYERMFTWFIIFTVAFCLLSQVLQVFFLFGLQ